MDYLRDSILATLAYYDILDMSLTHLEVYKFLINPARVYRTSEEIKDASLHDVMITLAKMVKSETIGQKNGFYFLPRKDELYDLRIASEKISAQKWKKMVSLAKWFAVVPYLRGLFASGSMAVGNVNEKSDFDILVISKPGRLYTARLFLYLVASLMRSRRGRYDKIAPNKFCLNHHIVDTRLRLEHESLFNAQTYASLKPILIEQDLFNSFYSANNWINKFVCNFKPNSDFVERRLEANKFLSVVAKAMESLLDNRFGDFVEKILRNYQQRRIRNNPVTYATRGRIIFNDVELEFHPHSFEALVIGDYNDKIRKLGLLPPIEEKDSGLK